DGKQNGYGDDVADDVGEDRSKQRRGAGDGEAAEAVEDALLHVNVQRHAGGHHPGQTCAGDDDAGKDILDVVTGGAGDGAAEQVDEQHQEDHRRHHSVRQESRVASGLGQAPPREQKAVTDQSRPALSGGKGRGGCPCHERGPSPARALSCVPAEAPESPVLIASPVREKNPSSRLGSRSENSVIAMPASANRRVRSATAPSSSTRTRSS